VVVAAVALPLGTFHLETLSTSQGGEPWAWSGLSTLPGLLGLPAAVISLLLIPRSPSMGTTALVLDRQRLFVGASLFAIVFLGGFQLPFVAGDPLLGSPVAAALAFVVKALVVVALAARSRRGSSSPRVLAWVSWTSASLSALSAATIAIFPFVAPPAWAVGPVAVVAVTTISVVALLRVRARDAVISPSRLALFS
jgi:hypothetical protein